MVIVYSPIKTRQQICTLRFVNMSLVSFVFNVITPSGKSLGKYIIIYFYPAFPPMVNARHQGLSAFRLGFHPADFSCLTDGLYGDFLSSRLYGAR